MVSTSEDFEWALTEKNPNRQGGGLSLPFTSILSFEITAESDSPSEPVEKGEFAAYNKTSKPREIRCSLAKRVTGAEAQEFLDTLERWRTQPVLVDVLTLDDLYMDFTLVSYSYTRTADMGRDNLVVDVVLKEVKEVETKYTRIRLEDTKDPQHADSIDRGFVPTVRVSVLKKTKNASDSL